MGLIIKFGVIKKNFFDTEKSFLLGPLLNIRTVSPTIFIILLSASPKEYRDITWKEMNLSDTQIVIKIV
jgi:hypothetical protein